MPLALARHPDDILELAARGRRPPRQLALQVADFGVSRGAARTTIDSASLMTLAASSNRRARPYSVGLDLIASVIHCSIATNAGPDNPVRARVAVHASANH